jgi:type IV pilus assembly protein PilM
MKSLTDLLSSFSGFRSNKPRPTVGVDIGSRRLKAAAIEERAGALVITRLIDEPIPGALISGSDVLDPEGLSEEISKIASEYDIHRADAVLMVGGEHVIVKRLQVPRVARDQAWRQLPVNPAFIKMLPGDPQNLNYDLDILDPEGRDLHMQVLVAVARKDAIRVRQKVLVDAGMQVKAVDVDAFALFNVAKHCMPDIERAAILNIGHDASLLVVIEDGIPALSRHLPVGMAQLVEGFHSGGLMPVEEMEKVLFFGNAVSMHPEAFQNWVKLLASEYQLSVGQFTRGRGRGSLDLFICGGGGRVDSLPDLIQSAVGGAVRLFNPLDHFRLDSTAQPVGGRARKAEGAGYALAIGLALRTIE